jgi:nitroimidazol reductase NimA-like FMN-containing flavoprotein (pyridoxamine 5'-phosphate oxidase superfamily)
MIDMTFDEIDSLLEESHIGRLCMVDASGRPYTIPFPFCWAEGTIYVRLPLTGRKGQILERNDWVCFEVDRYTATFDQYASVLIEGQLIAVADPAEKIRVKEMNDRKYTRLRGGYRPGHGRAYARADLPLRKIQVERLSGRRNGATFPAHDIARQGELQACADDWCI